jgi:hypothetical protein
VSPATDDRDERAAEFRAELEERLQGRSPQDRRLIFVGLLHEHLSELGEEIVLVGGGAVELYTSGAYTTADVDLVGRTSAVASLLEPAGFARDGRYFVAPELELVVEVPCRRLRETEDIRVVAFEDLETPVVSPEDILVDRLLAANLRESPTDRRQAVTLFAAHEDRFDHEALSEKARHHDVEDTLQEVRETVEDVEGTG